MTLILPYMNGPTEPEPEIKLGVIRDHCTALPLSPVARTFILRGNRFGSLRCFVRRLTTTVLLGFAGVAFAAPALKDRPKKDTSIVGNWWMMPLHANNPDSYRSSETFRADGTRLTWRRLGEEEKEIAGRYTVDTTMEPAQVEYMYVNGTPYARGIFKIDGDTLTVCLRAGGGPRPAKFGEEDSATFVFIRVTTRD
jgi:uncharacterized protein (TIGR03067 family)